MLGLYQGASPAACRQHGVVRQPYRRADVACCSSSRRVVLLGTTAVGVAAPAIGADAAGLPIVPKATVSSDLSVSQVIKGNWQLSGGHRGDKADDRTAGDAAVKDFQAFVDAGITTFDTADIYGPSESLIGQYIRSRADKGAGLQVLTKCCKFGSEQLNVSQSSISKGITGSRERLGLKSLDLVQFYWNDYSIKKYVSAAQYIAEEQARGHVKNIGVTNFDVPRIQEMMDGGVRIAGNQIQYSLLDRRPENGTVAFCQQHDVKILPFGTVAGGLLSDRYLGFPASELKLNTYSKSKYASIISQSGGWTWFQELLQALDSVAKKHNSNISNVACRWVLDKPQVAGLIVGARNAKHVSDHQALFDLTLSADDLGVIQEVLAKGKQAKGDVYSWERGGVW